MIYRHYKKRTQGLLVAWVAYEDVWRLKFYYFPADVKRLTTETFDPYEQSKFE